MGVLGQLGDNSSEVLSIALRTKVTCLTSNVLTQMSLWSLESFASMTDTYSKSKEI